MNVGVTPQCPPHTRRSCDFGECDPKRRISKKQDCYILSILKNCFHSIESTSQVSWNEHVAILENCTVFAELLKFQNLPKCHSRDDFDPEAALCRAVAHWFEPTLHAIVFLPQPTHGTLKTLN